jgi:elongation factor Ts
MWLKRYQKGRLKKFFAEICLLEQPYVKDNDVTIEELVKENIIKIGENIIIKRFTRYVLGEEA